MSNAATVSALLLFALAGGFLFAYNWKLTRYVALRLEGQQLLFMAVGFAVPLVIVARLFLLGAPYVFPEYIINVVGEVWSTLVKPLGKMPVLPTFFAAFVLGPVLGLLFEAFTPKGRTANYMMNRFGSDLERFLYYSVRGRLFVSVTLDNRKVYIGWTALTPLSGSSHEDGARDFTLLPVLSGYRNSDTLRLEITTDYTGAYEEIQRRGTNVGVEDFAIVIPVSRVVTANLFSLDLEQDIFDISPTQNAGFVSPPTATDEAG